MRIIFILLCLLNLSYAEKLHFRQVFNDFTYLKYLNDQDLDVYYFNAAPHLRKTIQHLLLRDKTSAHQSLKEDSLKSWRYSIHTAFVAFEYFKDHNILDREIKRLHQMPAHSEMLNSFARLLIYTDRKNDAVKVLSKSLTQAESYEEVFEITRLFDLIEHKLGLLECYKAVCKNNYSSYRHGQNYLKLFFANYFRNDKLLAQYYNELDFIDIDFHSFSSLYNIIPINKKWEFLNRYKHKHDIKEILYLSGIFKIPDPHVEKLIDKMIPEYKESIKDKMDNNIG